MSTYTYMCVCILYVFFKKNLHDRVKEMDCSSQDFVITTPMLSVSLLKVSDF